jgi:hypothetical protein
MTGPVKTETQRWCRCRPQGPPGTGSAAGVARSSGLWRRPILSRRVGHRLVAEPLRPSGAGRSVPRRSGRDVHSACDHTSCRDGADGPGGRSGAFAQARRAADGEHGRCMSAHGDHGPSGERSPGPWCWGSRSEAFGPSTRGLHSLLRMQVCGRDTRVTFVITILGAALGPLPCCWSSSQGGYFVVLVAGAILCARAATANLVAKPPRPKPLARSYRHRD